MENDMSNPCGYFSENSSPPGCKRKHEIVCKRIAELEQKCAEFEEQLTSTNSKLRIACDNHKNAVNTQAELITKIQELEAENVRLKDENKILERGWGNCSADRLIKTEQRDKAVELLRAIIAITDRKHDTWDAAKAFLKELEVSDDV